MTDTINIWLPDAQSTLSAGHALANSLYQDTTILLSGELGAGKTTFLQGFAAEIGVREHVSSPTYALEQRYQTDRWHELIHIDCYRLSREESEKLVSATDDQKGIRCIEWADHLDADRRTTAIVLEFQEPEDATGRSLSITFNDLPLPSDDQIEQWRADLLLPQHIADHCDAVADMAVSIADSLLQRGIIIRRDAVRKAARVHDLLRFVDFKAHSSPFQPPTEKQEAHWAPWRERFTDHQIAAAVFLQEHGFDGLAMIVEKHGLHDLPLDDDATTEQKVLNYADKRIRFTDVVTLDERFQDFANRYNMGVLSDQAKGWLVEIRKIETELLPVKKQETRSKNQ